MLQGGSDARRTENTMDDFSAATDVTAAVQIGPTWLPAACPCARPVEAFDVDGTPRCGRHASLDW